MKKFGFTLVELVITITILAILSTIAFVSFQSYTKDSRDANRLATLNQLSNGLNLAFSKNGSYPTPESPVSLLASGSIIGYQGTIGSNLFSQIGLQSEAKDPLDKKYYTYRTDTSGEKYQILALLENEDNALTYSQNVFAGYEKRSLKGLGDGIGILLDTANTPIQELSLTGVDIVTTNTSYKAFIKSSSSVSGTGYVLSYLRDGAGVSCNDILEKDKNKKNKDGVYLINSTGTGSFQVYCDMTTDGGGWTLVYSANNSSSGYKGFIGGLTSLNPLSGEFSSPGVISVIQKSKLSYWTYNESGFNRILGNTFGYYMEIPFPNMFIGGSLNDVIQQSGKLYDVHGNNIGLAWVNPKTWLFTRNGGKSIGFQVYATRPNFPPWSDNTNYTFGYKSQGNTFRICAEANSCGSDNWGNHPLDKNNPTQAVNIAGVYNIWVK